MNRPTEAIIDLDLYKYTAASAGEKRSIVVTHKASKKVKEFKTRTEFWGHHLKKSGGWLAELNKTRTSPFMPDEFEIEDVQTPDPIENILYTAKVMVEKDLELSGAENYKAYLGEGDSFRVERSTLLKYKDREHLIKPIHLNEVTEYLRKKFKAETVTGIEADDKILIECYNNPNRFGMIEDKDFWGCPMYVWDRNQQERGIVNCNKYGKIFLDSKGKVRGEGRAFFYWQVAAQDDIDNYKANCFSDVSWGEKSAYKALLNCKSDKEALQTLVDIYKKLYPEPKVVEGWKQIEFEIDWLYVLTENFDMARMLRFDEDHVNVKDVLIKMGVEI